MGQVWLYRLNLPPREKNIFPSSSYKDTWPMPDYRCGSTCTSFEYSEIEILISLSYSNFP